MVLHEAETRIGGAIELPDEFVHVGAWIAVGLVRPSEPQDVVLGPVTWWVEWVGFRMMFAHPAAPFASCLYAVAHDVKIERICGLVVTRQSSGALLGSELRLDRFTVCENAGMQPVMEQEPVFEARDGKRDMNAMSLSERERLLEPRETVMMLTLAVTHNPDLIVGDGLQPICECLFLLTPLDGVLNKVQWVAIRCLNHDIVGGEPQLAAEVVEIATLRMRAFE